MADLDAGSTMSLAAVPDPVLPETVDVTPASFSPDAGPAFTTSAYAPAGSSRAELDRLIVLHASLNGVPERLVRRVVERESNYRPQAYSRGNWGLMQIKHQTARTMGYRGAPEGLLDAETNLKYAVRYLRGAYLVADGNEDQAIRLYARGYYYDAKRKGLLEATGLRS